MSAPSNPPTKMTHPLPLSSTLHDLALLRASDLDLAALLPQSPDSAGVEQASAIEESVQRSLEFSREARAALKLLYSDAVGLEGAKVEDVRGRLDDVVSGLDA
ncbi:hypothetical protein C8Q80DRAFT_138339 [Daedaleopsis nitida]|nr:hypothetical protein C8Q80DRAFT_138339 [Daedaleopsis nitida]